MFVPSALEDSLPRERRKEDGDVVPDDDVREKTVRSDEGDEGDEPEESNLEGVPVVRVPHEDEEKKRDRRQVLECYRDKETAKVKGEEGRGYGVQLLEDVCLESEEGRIDVQKIEAQVGNEEGKQDFVH